MAIVTLGDLWIHLASNLATFVQVYMGALQEESGVSGEVRRYANGVFRSITTAGNSRSIQVEMPYLDRDDLETLEGWVGQAVMVRDPLGRKVFGTFFTIETSERPIGDADTALGVTFTLSALSLSEEV